MFPWHEWLLTSIDSFPLSIFLISVQTRSALYSSLILHCLISVGLRNWNLVNFVYQIDCFMPLQFLNIFVGTFRVTFDSLLLCSCDVFYSTTHYTYIDTVWVYAFDVRVCVRAHVCECVQYMKVNILGHASVCMCIWGPNLMQGVFLHHSSTCTLGPDSLLELPIGSLGNWLVLRIPRLTFHILLKWAGDHTQLALAWILQIRILVLMFAS